MRFSIPATALLAPFCTLVLAVLPSACERAPTTGLQAGSAAGARAGYDGPGTHRQYGVPVPLGEGKVRAYVVLDSKAGGAPLEIGVAVDARTLEGPLPDEMLRMPLQLPAQAPEPYRFVLFDWNPHGHAPPGVYEVPHFDFHFYFAPLAEVRAISRSDPRFAAEANHVPGPEFVPPHYTVPYPPGTAPAAVAEPGMGVHWEDVRAPQLQRLFGHPEAYAPFTKAFIYGSWDGRFTFVEPMITREYLLRRTDEIVPVERPARYAQPGWYPGSYRITYDPQAREYRVALVDLTWHS
jgi:hypothetical protein